MSTSAAEQKKSRERKTRTQNHPAVVMVWREDDHHIPYDSISLALFRASRYGIKSIPTFLPLSRFFFPLQVSHIYIHTSIYIVYPLLPAYIHVRPLFLSYNLINFFFFPSSSFLHHVRPRSNRSRPPKGIQRYVVQRML